MWCNDTSLGEFKVASARLPDDYAGHWMSESWIGVKTPAASPDLATILATFISPEMYLKIFTPLTMLLLGLSAWVLFRQLKFSPMASVAGGLAAGLNMHCFSNACWGTGTWNIAMAMTFLAVAVLVSDSIRHHWMKAALAGLAVGMGVMEGFDTGAILSVFTAVFVMFFCWITEAGVARRVWRGLSVAVLVAGFAVWIAASTLSTLVGTSIKGVAGMGQTAEEKQNRWTEATMWSLPKLETLRVIIPGLFGYRLENYDTTPDHAGVYWGSVAEDPTLTALKSSDAGTRAKMAAQLHLLPEEASILQGGDAQAREAVVDSVVQRLAATQRVSLQRRHTGSGEFAGVLVSLLALFAVTSTFRRDQPPYSKNERRMVWFWSLAALFSLVAAWGRYSFLYALLYKIPWFSTIRNPMKFMTPFHLALIILAGFGLEALWRRHLQSAAPAESGAPEAAETKPFTTFERWWLGGLVLTAIAAGLAYWNYGAGNTGSSRHVLESLTRYIGHQGFGEEWGARIATFAVRELGWFVIFLAASAGAVALILTGVLRGRRAVWAGVLVCGVMICELSRADQPWVRYFNYREKYSDSEDNSVNDIVKILRQEPWEHRVAAKLVPNGGGYPLCDASFPGMGQVCHWWLENDFPYNDIQTVDLDQMARPPMLETNVFAVFAPRYPPASSGISGQLDLSPPVRLWKLCNTRYLIAPADMAEFLNENGDPVQRGFQIRARFDLVPKPWVTNMEDMGDVTVKITNGGRCALIEITNALPRAKLYSNWEIPADDTAALQLLNSAQFDPMKTVLVSSNTPVAPAAASDADPGTVRIVDYKPREVHLRASAKTGAVLLLNDRTDPDWHAWVDGKPVEPLRCNYMMRGVYLTAGEHSVDFRFQPSKGFLYVSLAGLGFGILLGAWLVRGHLKRPRPVATIPAPEPKVPPGAKPRAA